MVRKLEHSKLEHSMLVGKLNSVLCFQRRHRCTGKGVEEMKRELRLQVCWCSLWQAFLQRRERAGPLAKPDALNRGLSVGKTRKPTRSCAVHRK